MRTRTRNTMTMMEAAPHPILFFRGFERGRIQITPVGKQPIIFGRASNAEVMLLYGPVGPRHARVSFFNGAFRVEHLGSANATYVNGKPIRREAELHVGDILTIEPIEFEVIAIGMDLRAEEASFIEAIDRDPDNTDLHEVYADWLEQEGRPRGAEQLRKRRAFPCAWGG